MTITNDTSAPLVAVIGATGNQGSSVVDHLELSKTDYRIRAFTRDTSKPAAKALEKRGAETYALTLQAGAEQEVKKAFEGADIVFAVTDFWSHTSKEKEIAEGKLVVDAVAAAKVPLFIYSGLPPVTELSKGALKGVLHFDSKAEVTAYARSIASSSGFRVIDVQPGYYASNFVTFKPQKLDNGDYVYAFPIPTNIKFPVIDTKRDYGAYVVAAIEQLKGSSGELEVRTWSDEVSPDEIGQLIGEAVGKKVLVSQVPPQDYIGALSGAGLPEFLARELTEMYQFFEPPLGYFGGMEVTRDLKLGQSPISFKDWVKQQDWTEVFA